MLRGDEGRGRLRKASGSCQTRIDPKISEWGNLLRNKTVVSVSEYIGYRSERREVKHLSSSGKERNSISLVAASETE